MSSFAQATATPAVCENAQPPREPRGPDSNRKPTARQLAVLRFIAANIVERGFPPTTREIQDHFGYRSSYSADCHLSLLAKKGLIRNHGTFQQARRTSITDEGHRALGAELPQRLPAKPDPRFRFIPMRRCAVCEFTTLRPKCCEVATRLEVWS
jgi:hypothetical protein